VWCACDLWRWWSGALPAYVGKALRPHRWTAALGRRHCTSDGTDWAF
jgi:hypothetical protein